MGNLSQSVGLSLRLYLLLLLLATLLFVWGLGGGLFGLDAHSTYHQFTHLFFSHACHQIPERSLVLNEVTMAFCSRCLGVYSSFAIGLVLGGILHRAKWLFKKRPVLASIVLSMVVIGIDVVGNAFGFWTNTHLSRILTGVWFGGSLSWLLAGELQTNFIRKD